MSGNHTLAYAAVFNTFTISQMDLQQVMVSHLESLVSLSKMEVLSDASLKYLFANTPRGVNRGALSAWWVAHSPLRPVFKGNGQLDTIRWAKNGAWKLEEAKNALWWECEPEQTSKVRVPELDKAIEALILACAKISRVDTDATPENLAKAIGDMVPAFGKLISEARDFDKVEKWSDKLAAQAAAKA